jgi:hypothetical protein
MPGHGNRSSDDPAQLSRSKRQRRRRGHLICAHSDERPIFEAPQHLRSWREADDEPHIWGRVVGQHGLQGCAANLEKDVDYDMFAVRAGMDLYYAEGPDGGSDRAGIYGAIGNASGEAHLFDVSVGSNDNDAYTVGGDWRRTTAGRGGMSMPFCRAPGTTSKPIRTARSRSRPPASASAHRWRPAIRSRWRVAGSSSRRHSWHISQEREGASLVAVMNSLIGDCSRRMKSIRDCIRAD